MLANFKDHTVQTLFGPELQRRIAAGAWAEDEPVRAAQALLRPGQKPEIRFNDEVRIQLGVTQEQRQRNGETVEELVNIEWFELPADEQAYAHMTLLSVGGRDFGGFDARYHLPTVREHLVAAAEFLDTARDALEAGRLRAFAENLFAAVELAGRAFFVQAGDARFLRRGTHGLTQAEFNRARKAGNVDPAHADLLNTLARFRPGARYLNRSWELDAAAARDMLDRASELHARMAAESAPAREQRGPVLRRGRLDA